MQTALLDRPAAAQYLGIKPNTLAIWASTKRHEIPYIKVGRSVRYRIEDLNAFVLKQTVGCNLD